MRLRSLLATPLLAMILVCLALPARAASVQVVFGTSWDGADQSLHPQRQDETPSRPA